MWSKHHIFIWSLCDRLMHCPSIPATRRGAQGFSAQPLRMCLALITGNISWPRPVICWSPARAIARRQPVCRVRQAASGCCVLPGCSGHGGCDQGKRDSASRANAGLVLVLQLLGRAQGLTASAV